MNRIAVAVFAAAGLGLLAAGCGSSPTGQVGQSSAESGALAFARCMRSHGLPGWPDPTASGAFGKSKLTPRELGAGSSRIEAAQNACRRLLPGGAAVPDQALLQQVKAVALSFSRCVRNHGVPNFPDPGGDGRIPDPASVGIDQGSPRFEAANQACRRYRPPYMPSNAAYNSWARSARQ